MNTLLKAMTWSAISWIVLTTCPLKATADTSPVIASADSQPEASQSGGLSPGTRQPDGLPPEVISWDGELITVSASATANPALAVNLGHAYSLALKTARHLAYEKLAEKIRGIWLQSRARYDGAGSADSVLETRLQGLVKGATIVKEEHRLLEDGSAWAEVTLAIGKGAATSHLIATLAAAKSIEVPVAANVSAPSTTTPQLEIPPTVENSFQQAKALVAGQDSQPNQKTQQKVAQKKKEATPQRKRSSQPATVALPATAAPDELAATSPAPDAPLLAGVEIAGPADAGRASSAIETVSSPKWRPITGLIVNAAHLGVTPSTSPTLVSEAGEELYGAGCGLIECERRLGFAGYANDISEALKKQRTGDHPLVINAIRRTVRGRSGLVVSDEDAAKVLAAERDYQVLSGCQVIVVMNDGGEL